MHVPRRPLLMLTTLVVAACASAGQGGDDGPRRDPNLLTSEEMVEFSSDTLYEVIQRLRPRWLRGRGRGDTALRMDGQRTELRVLRSVRPADVELVRWVSAQDATTRFGTGYANGLIEVVSRRIRDF